MFKAATLDFLQVNAGHIPEVENFLSQGGHAIGTQFLILCRHEIYNCGLSANEGIALFGVCQRGR